MKYSQSCVRRAASQGQEQKLTVMNCWVLNTDQLTVKMNIWDFKMLYFKDRWPFSEDDH